MGKFFKNAGVRAEVYKTIKKARNMIANVRTEKEAKKVYAKLQGFMREGKKLEKKYGKDAVRKAEKTFTVEGRGKSHRKVQDIVQKAMGKGRGQGTKTHKKMKEAVKKVKGNSKILQERMEQIKKVMADLK